MSESLLIQKRKQNLEQFYASTAYAQLANQVQKHTFVNVFLIHSHCEPDKPFLMRVEG